MKQRILITLICCLTTLTGAWAQSDDFGVWTSAEVKKRLFPGFDASVEGEFRTRDGLSEVDRWSLAAGVSYKFTSFLKADLGYTYIHSHQEAETTKKGNYIPSYWSPRHRVTASLTGSYTWKRLEFSLRERFQYTYRTSMYTEKYDGDDGSQKDDEYISAKEKSVLRSRLQVEWDIKKCKFSPYASCELYHSITDGWAIDKTRWTIGTAYKLNKKHSLDFYYRYQNHADDDETNGHVLGIGYKLKF